MPDHAGSVRDIFDMIHLVGQTMSHLFHKKFEWDEYPAMAATSGLGARMCQDFDRYLIGRKSNEQRPC